jgi:hypothetical protein
LKNKVDGVQKDVKELQDKVDELLKKLDVQEKQKSRVVPLLRGRVPWRGLRKAHLVSGGLTGLSG